jgi:hypothetical protein
MATKTANKAMQSMLTDKTPKRDAKVVRFITDLGILHTTPEKRWTSRVEGEKHPSALKMQSSSKSQTSKPERLDGPGKHDFVTPTPWRASERQLANVQHSPLEFTSESFPSLGHTGQASKPREPQTRHATWGARVKGQLSVAKSNQPATDAPKLPSKPKPKLVFKSLTSLKSEDWDENNDVQESAKTFDLAEDGLGD